MPAIEQLKKLIVEQLDQTTDTELLDLVLKLLITESQAQPGAA